MTPMVFPSSFLLRKAAITPTLNRTESKVLALCIMIQIDKTCRSNRLNIQSSETCSAVLKADTSGFGVDF